MTNVAYLEGCKQSARPVSSGYPLCPEHGWGKAREREEGEPCKHLGEVRPDEGAGPRRGVWSI